MAARRLTRILKNGSLRTNELGFNVNRSGDFEIKSIDLITVNYNKA
jgi:hypothetical protein